MLFWSREEAQGFLGFTNERYPSGTAFRWVHVVYLLALNTGMRAGEIWGLKPVDLSECGSKIAVRRQFNRISLEFTETKGKKIRHVPFNKELRLELLELIRKMKVTRDETIFQNENRKPVCHENFVERKFMKDVAVFGGRRIRFHDLRHTAATLMLASGVDIKTVQSICGTQI